MYDSFFEHIQQLQGVCEKVLAATGFDAVLIGSGQPHKHFLDDYYTAFKANPHFVHWLPFLTEQPNCWLLVKPGQKPQLLFYAPDDFWHEVADVPADDWTQAFDVQGYKDSAVVEKQCKGIKRLAVINEQSAPLNCDDWQHNPQTLIDYLHYERAVKTPWEQEQLWQANKLASRAHRLAEKMFHDGASEYQIHQAYISEVGCNERQLPYGNIVALNEHAAVLHYQFQQRNKPEVHRTLLLDAGASVNGYAADITRTFTGKGTLFAEMVDALDMAQRRLVDSIYPGVNFVELHRKMHLEIAALLSRFDLAKGSAEALVESGVTRTFFPHGLGHYLGIQVHDVGGWQADHQGSIVEPPTEHPFLRLTRTLEAGNFITIEPGFYFIPSLLAELRADEAAGLVNWALVDSLIPWGGIRIEDNILVTDQGADNYTRRAFQLLN